MRSVWMLLVIVAAVGLLVMPAMALEEVSDDELTQVKGQAPVQGECLRQTGCPANCPHTQWICEFVVGSSDTCHEAKFIGYLKCVNVGTKVKCWDTTDICVCWCLYKDTLPPGITACWILYNGNLLDLCIHVRDSGCPDNKCNDETGAPPCPTCA